MRLAGRESWMSTRCPAAGSTSCCARASRPVSCSTSGCTALTTRITRVSGTWTSTGRSSRGSYGTRSRSGSRGRRSSETSSMSDVGEGIVVQDGRYFAAQWFASGDGWDLLVALWRDPGGPWVAQGRIRRHVDDLVHDSDDEKVWFSAQVRDLDADEPA